MEIDVLRNEIKKVRNECTELQTTFETSSSELLNAITDNKSLKDENKILKEKLSDIEKSITNSQKENQALLASKKDLHENIQHLKRNTLEQNTLKAEVLTLEEQVIQLRLQLDTIKSQNTQKIQENMFLNECLVNANNDVVEKENNLKEKIAEIKQFQDQIEGTKEEKIVLQQHYKDITAEIQQNSQERNNLLDALQKNRVLIADNNRLQNELEEIVRSNETFQTRACLNKKQVGDLRANLKIATETIAGLERQRSENLTQIDVFTEMLSNAEISLNAAIDDKNNKKLKHHSLEEQLTELELNYQNLEQLRKRGTDQLLYILELNSKLEKEIQSVNDIKDNSDTVGDLKLALLTSIANTRVVFDKLDGLRVHLLNAEFDESDDGINIAAAPVLY